MSVAIGRMPNDATAPAVYGYPDLPESWESAVLLVDKPKGMSSFGVIRQIRRRVPVRKVGHAGTLDPMATGMLIVLVGRATKSMESFMGLDKEYTGVIRLGETTASFDAETPVDESLPVDHIDDESILEAARTLTGDVTQRPPLYSAIKVGGERLYKKARRGEQFEVPTRVVRVDEFDVEPRDGRDVRFRVACSKGTYVRSLAHDLGAALGVGGHLSALRRTAIGEYRVDNAWNLDTLCDQLERHAG